MQAELFWDLSEDGASWQTGFRLDVRVRSDDRPGLLGVNWMNHWSLSDVLTARFLILSAIDIGDNAQDDVFWQTRASLYRRFGKVTSLGLELYNSHGSTDRFIHFEDRRHQLGPTAVFRLGKGRTLLTNVLFGLTDETPDMELRTWFTLSF